MFLVGNTLALKMRQHRPALQKRVTLTETDETCLKLRQNRQILCKYDLHPQHRSVSYKVDRILPQKDMDPHIRHLTSMEIAELTPQYYNEHKSIHSYTVLTNIGSNIYLSI